MPEMIPPLDLDRLAKGYSYPSIMIIGDLRVSKHPSKHLSMGRGPRNPGQ